MSVGLNVTKFQESLFLGTLIAILVAKSVVRGVTRQLLMRFLVWYTCRIIERENSFLTFTGKLYGIIFIKIPAVMDMSLYRFVDKVEYFGAVCIP
jgi:hypothetical protein